MGFGSIVSQIIMFIAVISLATGVVVVFKTYVDQSNSAMTEQWKGMSNNLKTDILITSATFNSTTNLTTIYVQNKGKTLLSLSYIDVYLDNMFVPRSASNRSMAIESSTDIRNPGVFDPTEIMKIEVNYSLNNGSHLVDVATEYGVIDTFSFTS